MSLTSSKTASLIVISEARGAFREAGGMIAEKELEFVERGQGQRKMEFASKDQGARFKERGKATANPVKKTEYRLEKKIKIGKKEMSNK